MKFGSITTGIIADGLVFNMDPANRASTKPISTITTSFNTLDTSISGAFSDNGIFDSSTITPSFAFGGTDDNIDIDSFNLGTNNTISLWYNSTGKSPNYFTLLGNDDAPNDYAIWMSYSTNIYYKVEDPSNEYVGWTGISNYNDGNWHNLVFSRVDQTVNLYIDTIIQTVTYNNLANNNTVIDKIGSKSNNTDWFKGNLASIQFYNRALSANEVLHNYNALKGRFGL